MGGAAGLCALAVWSLCAAGCCARAPACPRDAAPGRCVDLGGGYNDYNFSVDGEDIVIKVIDGGHFWLECGVRATLDNEALPRFDETMRVSRVYLVACPPPARSYARALRALNVQPLTDLVLRRARGLVAGRHLEGLTVSSLALVELPVSADAFSVYRPKQLRLDTVKSIAISDLPASIQNLHVVAMGIRNVTGADLRSLPALTKLTVREEGTINVEGTGNLSELALQAESVFVDPTLPDTLERLTIDGWAELAPAPWKSCSALKELVIDGRVNSTLPDGWLANCKSLRNVTVRKCGLEKLPIGLLDNAHSLSLLNLSGNRLTELPSGLFAATRELGELDLSHNDLANDAFRKLESVTSLVALRLDYNRRLGDACLNNNGVALQQLGRLRRLRLRATGASRVCRAFRAGMPLLRLLDLADNRITELTFSDVHFDSDVEVDLRGNRVERLQYTRDEYRRLLRHPELYCAGAGGARPALASRAGLALGAALRCDCGELWAALALRDCPAHAAPGLLRARCAGGEALAGVALDALVCARPAAACGALPPACACAERAARSGQRVLRVACAGAGLRAPPALALGAAGRGALWQLQLANNSLRALRRADLPPHLHTLDVRGNPLSIVDPAIVAALPDDGRLWLANNSVSCDCDNAAGLAALLRRRGVVPALSALRCAGGAALREPACGAGGALAAAALLPLLGALLGAWLLRRRLRAALKRALGGLPRAGAGADEDDGRPFDVFVSFSHRDEEVVRALLAALEPRWRVLVHFRDWVPGGWIPAQIAASVRRSRRTLAVVSEHFLRSAWARAEFREAHAAALRDATPRLLVVLLEEPARLPLDAELRAYLAANTYVRWGDRWFWPRLRAALPPPRGPAPADPAGPDPAGPDPAAPALLELSARKLTGAAA